jgi:hypothetical protein
MKVVITENKLFNSIYNYIDETFNPKEMDWVYGLGVDDDGYVDIDKENENFLIFFKGDWEGEEDSDSVFHYFDVDFYDKNDPSHKPFRDKTPILEVLGEYGRHLDSMFDNHWHEPMKKWFQYNFNLPVKTLSTYYNYENYN